MTNKEMEQLQNTITLLTALQDHAIHSETFMDDTGITICSITTCINSLREIHLKETIIRDRCRKQANAWNKAHPEQHRKHNRESNKRHPKTEYQREYYKRRKASKGGEV